MTEKKESRTKLGVFVRQIGSKLRSRFHKHDGEDDLDADIIIGLDPSRLMRDPLGLADAVKTPSTSTQEYMNGELCVVKLNKSRRDLTHMERMMNEGDSKAVYEIVDVEFCREEIHSGCRIPFTYKNAKCEIIVDDKTVTLAEQDAVLTRAIISRPQKYVRCLGESELFPLSCLCVTDEYYFSLFDDVRGAEQKVTAMREFAKLSLYQREFVISMHDRPRIEESAEAAEAADGFMPIRDEKALKMMYQLCRPTYKPSIRARVDGLFEQLSRSHGSEHTNLLNQIAYMVGIDTRAFPQNKKTYDEILAIMDKHIYGMKELKIAIAEFIIAMQYSGDPYWAILLVGPPGVGKTNVSEAIVECMGIPLLHIDCSGVDVITMSGLIKAYNGAKASKVMDAFYEAGRTDVVMLFDEIDKMEKSKEGDPYGALIKPLGPQRKYYDEYVASDTDVSATKFIATANDINKIPGYILNRFEGNIFTIEPYSVEEKVEIARNHIVPNKLEAFNISPEDVVFSDKALYALVRDYCNDAGARELSGCITKLLRKIITEWSRGLTEKPLYVDEEYVHSRLLSKNVCGKRQIGF